MAEFEKCPNCDGTGKTGLLGSEGMGLVHKTCKVCGGTGRKPQEEGKAAHSSNRESQETNAGSSENSIEEVVSEGLSAMAKKMEEGLSALTSDEKKDTAESSASAAPEPEKKGGFLSHLSGAPAHPKPASPEPSHSEEKTTKEALGETLGGVQHLAEDGIAAITGTVENALHYLEGETPDPPSNSGDANEELLSRNQAGASRHYSPVPFRPDDDDDDRAGDYVRSLRPDEPHTKLQEAAHCFLKYLAKPLIYIVMVYAYVIEQGYRLYLVMPVSYMKMIFGLALCFFGGTYFVSIAAIEAATNFGGHSLVKALKRVYKEGKIATLASMHDDEQHPDAAYDMTPSELMHHKAVLCMSAIKNPEKLVNAVQCLVSAYVAVLATLKFQFARTLALALAIADMSHFIFVRMFGPFVLMAMGPKLQHWVSPIISIVIKLIAVIIASYIQMIISAFYSGLRGGRMFALSFLRKLEKHGILDKLPDSWIAKPFDEKHSVWDEIIGYPLAFFGIWFQISNGFTLPFPLNIILLPLNIIEWFLRWKVFAPGG